jgi:hypothetical protein
MKLAKFDSSSTVFEVFRAFHQDMLSAVESDNFRDYGFCKGVGLCYNFKIWRAGKNLKEQDSVYDKYQKDYFNNVHYPFNLDSEDYNREQDETAGYSNPKRLEFIKKIASMN